jgi:hypothetical protein
MAHDHHKFIKGRIIDSNTVADSSGKQIDILDGGLPKNTTHITIRNDSVPDGNIVIGAYIRGRDMPITVRGKFKDDDAEQKL